MKTKRQFRKSFGTAGLIHCLLFSRRLIAIYADKCINTLFIRHAWLQKVATCRSQNKCCIHSKRERYEAGSIRGAFKKSITWHC